MHLVCINKLLRLAIQMKLLSNNQLLSELYKSTFADKSSSSWNYFNIAVLCSTNQLASCSGKKDPKFLKRWSETTTKCLVVLNFQKGIFACFINFVHAAMYCPETRNRLVVSFSRKPSTLQYHGYIEKVQLTAFQYSGKE